MFTTTLDGEAIWTDRLESVRKVRSPKAREVIEYVIRMTSGAEHRVSYAQLVENFKITPEQLDSLPIIENHRAPEGGTDGATPAAPDTPQAAPDTQQDSTTRCGPDNILKVTAVQVCPFTKKIRDDPTRPLKGLATVILGKQIVLRSVRITVRGGCLRVDYPPDPFNPQKDDPNTAGILKVYNPISRLLRERIEEAVLEKFRDEIEKGD